MTNELAAVGSQAMTTVEDVSGELELVAFNPADMPNAQKRLAAWFREKIKIVNRDVDDLAESLDVAVKAGWKTSALNRQHRHAKGRVEYYKKCLAAVEAGYCIVPNFPTDIIAIRTTKAFPKRDESESKFYDFPQYTNAPPAGQGRYVSQFPKKGSSTHHKDNKATGKTDVVRYYFSDSFEEVEFPIALCQPRVMDATQRAMAMKIFDSIGVLPARRQADPIVVGHVYPGRRHRVLETPLTFLIAWWIDTRTL